MAGPQEVLEELAKEPGPTRDRLLKEERAETLIDALGQAQDRHARMILCYVLGARHEQDAVDAIVECLSDPERKVRSSAADALAKIADPRAGEALWERFSLPDPDPGTQRMIVVALGAVGYREAIPSLIPLLEDPHPGMRGSAAWSLGVLGATEATKALARALDREESTYPKQRMAEALAGLKRAAESRLRGLERLGKSSQESGEPSLGPMVRGVERRMQNVEERIEELRPEGSEPLEARFIPRPHLEPPERYLPTGGSHPYEPPEDAGDKELVPHPSGRGLLDRYGNRWEWSEDRYAGPHWDVHHPDGRHTNVHPDGYFHQGRDRFPEKE